MDHVGVIYYLKAPSLPTLKPAKAKAKVWLVGITITLNNNNNKLGLSCAKLRFILASQ